MKQYLLIAATLLLALPVLTSCNKPSGDPEKDAEAFQGLFEEQQKIELEAQQKIADLAEYYAENKDYDAYQELQDEFLDITKDLQDKYEDQVKDLEKSIAKLEKKINKKNKNNDDEEESYDEEDEE